RGRLGDTGPNDEHVVAAGWHPFDPLPPELAQLPLELVPRDRIPDRAGDRHAEPRLGRLLLPEPVENEEARGHRPALAIDGVEVPRAGQTVRTLHGMNVTPKASRGP